MDDERLKQGQSAFGKDYFRELLERAVTGFFDYIKDLIERENTFSMVQFADCVNAFLLFRRYDILPDKVRISKAKADAKAQAGYDLFNPTQLIISDFDRAVKRLNDPKS